MKIALDSESIYDSLDLNVAVMVDYDCFRDVDKTAVDKERPVPICDFILWSFSLDSVGNVVPTGSGLSHN